MTVHSPTTFAPGEIFTRQSPSGVVWAIVTCVGDDPHYADLVTVPDGVRLENINRAQLRDHWLPADPDAPWEVQSWVQTEEGPRRLWVANVPSTDFVVALAKDVRARKSGEHLSVHVPANAGQLDLDALIAFRVERH